MASNAEIIRKADLAVSDLTTDGGLLNPEQANRFIRKLIKVPTLLRQVRTVEMLSPSRKINKIQFNKRILRAGTSSTALTDPADDAQDPFDPSNANTKRAKVLTEQIQLDTKEQLAEVRLPYDVIEDNIERGNIGAQTDVGGAGAGGGLIDTIVTLMAERAALDLEELAILGDTTVGAADLYLDQFDGYIKLINDNGNVSNVGGETISKKVFKNGMKTMPDQYLRQRSTMKHFVSQDNETEYRDTLADRATGLGDATIQGNSPVSAYSVPVEAVSLMPEDKGIFSNPLNMLWGVQRQMTMEFDKDISSRVFIIVLTMRIAIQVEETEAAVLYTNIGS